MQVLIMAKAPVAGRVKTRLCPPCTPEQAATLAEAALVDTIEAALASCADNVVLALDGERGPWCPAGVTVIPQSEGEFDRRLTSAWTEVGTPAVQIGMDTPQVTASMLDTAMKTLAAPGNDAVLGPAADGGWWLIGFDTTVGEDRLARAFLEVPMSRVDTCVRQIERLESLGLEWRQLEELTDVDTFPDAVEVATAAPDSRFARSLDSMAL